MSVNLTPNSTELVELTRIFRIIESQLKGLHAGQQSAHAAAQQALSYSQTSAKTTQPETMAPAAAIASPDAITMVVSSIPPA